MLTVSKGVLKAKMLEYFRRIEETGEELIVTNNYIPVLKVVPLHSKHSPDDIFQDVRPKFHATEAAVMSSTEMEWDILSSDNL